MKKKNIYRELGLMPPKKFKEKRLLSELSRLFEELPSILNDTYPTGLLQEFGKRQMGKTTDIFVDAYIQAHSGEDAFIICDSISVARRKNDIYSKHIARLNIKFGSPKGNITFISKTEEIATVKIFKDLD
jgi:hypothetical protein